MTRSSLLDVLVEDYIRTARAKGLHERLIVVKHALRNVVIPIVTIGSLQFVALLGGVVVTERVWNLKGWGTLSRTLKVRGGIVSQANRYLGCFCSSQRIFAPQIIQVLLLLVNGVINHDYPLVQTMIFMFAGLVIVANLLTDILYGWLDPRIRYQ